MKHVSLRSLVPLAVILGGVPAAQATTIAPLRFDELVQQAGVVVQGTVTDVRVLSTGADLPPAEESNVPSSPTAPISADVEGGRMLYTEVTLQVDRQIGDPVGPEIRFTLAGGRTEDESFIVFGMPRFEIGGRYILLLRRDFERTNVPVVGVSQGFFQIVRDPATDRDMLLDADGDIVLSIEDDRVALRRNPARARPHTPRLGPAPVPDEESDVRPGLSPRVERYWLSTESPTLPETFLDTARVMKEEQP